MKHSLLFALTLLPLLVACTSPSNKEQNKDISFEQGKNIQTRNYKNIKEDELHPEVDEGYTRISSVLINSEHFIDIAEDTTYLYKLSCKNGSDSFQTHRINCDDDGYYYAEISQTQHSYIPNGFSILKNNNKSGSAVEIVIEKIYKCITYTELYYSETEQKIKIINFDHVIPGLEESEVDSLLGKSVDYSVYVDESGIKSMNYGNLPFETELIINYIDVSKTAIKIN